MFNENVELRYDLVDTHISICSPVVLPLFSDNFDYQTWDDFVRGILVSEEILDNTIYYHQLEGSYAANVTNVQMYDAIRLVLFVRILNCSVIKTEFLKISKDIIQRWAYPLAPDLNRSDKVSRHTLSRFNIYKQPDVILAK